MSDFLLNAGRQTLMLELQEASRLPERLGEEFVCAANTLIHCEGKVIVSGIGKSGHIGKKIAATLARRCMAIWAWLKAATCCCLFPTPAQRKSWI